MKNLLVRFWKEEDGFGIVEVVIIMAIVVAAAIIFRNLLLPWIQRKSEAIFSSGGEVVDNIPEVDTNPTPTTTN